MEEGGLKVETIGILKKMKNVTKEEPSALSPNWVAKNGFKTFSPGHFEDEIGKINFGDDGQLKGSPETGIDFHQFWNPISWIHLEFNHTNACPV